MSKKTASSKKTAPPQRVRRLNVRALVVLVGFLIASVGCGALLLWYQNQNGSHALLVEAKSRFEKQQTSLGLEYLDRYLELNPDLSTPEAIEALELKGKTLAELAQSDGQLKEATDVLLKVIGSKPDRWEARRLLTKAYLKSFGMARSAEAQAKELVAHDPKDADAHRLLAHAILQISTVDKDLGVVDDALLNHYNVAEDIKPGDVDGARRFAAVYYELKQPKKAQDVLNELVTRTANDPKAQVSALLARSEYFRAVMQPPDWDKALADADLAYKKDPKNFEVLLAQANLVLTSDKPDPIAARHYLEQMSGTEHKDDLRVKLIEARIDLAENNLDDAIRVWREGLIRTGGNNADLTFQLAYTLLQIGRIKEAAPLVEQYSRLAVGDEAVATAHYLQGRLYLGTALASKRPEDAEKAVVEFEPIRYKIDKRLKRDYLLALGNAYVVRHHTGPEPDAPKALAAFEEATKLPGNSADSSLAIARLQAVANTSEAAATLRRGLAVNPGDSKLLTALAGMLLQKERQKSEKDRNWEELDRTLEDAKKAAPGSIDLVIVEVEYMLVRNRPEEAIGLLKAAVGLHPKSGELWLSLADIYSRTGKLDDAITATENGVAKVGPQVGFYNLRSKCWKLKGEGTKAKDALVEGVSRVPQEQRPTMYKLLGDFYQSRSDFVSAKAAYHEWARLDPTSPEPRQALFDLAFLSNDDKEIDKAIEEVRQVSGLKAFFWKNDQIRNLLRNRKGETSSTARDARLDEAAKLALEIQREEPGLGFELEGQIREAQRQVEPAIAAYYKALEAGRGLFVLNRLDTLLSRENRAEERERLRKNLASYPGLNQAVVQAPATEGLMEQLCALAIAGDPLGLNAKLWKNEIFKTLGNPILAEKEFELQIKNQPTKPNPWIQLLMLQICGRESAKAAATIERIRTNVQLDKLDLFLAVCYRVTGDAPQCLESYRRALKHTPDDVAALISAITFFDQVGARDDSEKALRSILQRDKANGFATRTLAKSLARHLGNAAAWNEALDLIGRDPKPNDNIDDALTRAEVYSWGPSLKERERGLDILLRLVKETPNVPILNFKAARFLFETKRLTEARDYAAKAAAGDAADPEAILEYAGLLVALKDIDAAQTQLNRLVALDPSGLPVADLKAKILVVQGKEAEATKVLEDAFNNHTSSTDLFTVGEKMVKKFVQMKEPEAAVRVARVLDEKAGPKGSCLLAETLVPLGKLDEAADLLEKAAKADDPADKANAGITALAFATAEKADPRWLPLADKLLAAALKGQPQSTELLLKQAILRHFQGNFEAEIAIYDSVLKMDPPSFEFLNNRAWALSEDLHRPDIGLRWADEALKKCGDQAHIRDTRGVILTRLERFDEAIKDLEVAVRDLPSGSTYYHLARALIKAKRPEEARKWQDLARKSGLTRTQLQPTELTDWDVVMGS